MNTGIQDAVMLGHVLTAVLAGRADEGRLDEYERVRRPVAQRVVAFTDRMTRIATLSTPRRRMMRNAVIRAVGPVAGGKLAFELAGLRNRPAAHAG